MIPVKQAGFNWKVFFLKKELVLNVENVACHDVQEVWYPQAVNQHWCHVLFVGRAGTWGLRIEKEKVRRTINGMPMPAALRVERAETATHHRPCSRPAHGSMMWGCMG